MNAKFHVYCGLIGTILIAAISEIFPGGGLLLTLAVAALAVAAAVRGARLPLAIRVLATSLILYFGYSTCLVGRTMEPRLTRQTISMALTVFCLLGLAPTLSILRLWPRRVAVSLVIAALPLGLAAATVVAGIEEDLFVQRYRTTGVGPTPRWTVSNHWLSYNRETHQLHGSD